MRGAAAGRYLGSHPRANVSMMSMRPPQHGHGRESAGGSAASADLGLSGIASGFGTFSNARALATLSARLPLARAFLILAESVRDSRIGISLIQHVSWNGGQLAWRELILLICVSELWRQFCGACRAGQWRCVSMSASRAW